MKRFSLLVMLLSLGFLAGCNKPAEKKAAPTDAAPPATPADGAAPADQPK